MIKITIITALSFIAASQAFSQNKSEMDNLDIQANILAACSIKIPENINFGTLNFAEPAIAPVIGNRYGTHREVPFNISVGCSSGVSYHLNYQTEERPALNSTIIIKGI